MSYQTTAPHERNTCETYKEIINTSKQNSPENYIFEGTKLDISKVLLNRSVITVSNTDRGISMNYTMKSPSKLFSASVFGDGSVLGKIIPTKEEGLSLTCMRGAANNYFDIGYTKLFKRWSVSLSAINPDVELSKADFYTKQINPSGMLKDLKEKWKANTLSQLLSISPQKINISEKLHSGLLEAHRRVNGGIFTISSVLKLSPTLHIGQETILSVSKSGLAPENDSSPTFSSLIQKYSKEIASTCIISKVFDSWRVLGIYHTAGPAGALIEKSIDESLSLHGEVSIDWRNILKSTEKVPSLPTVLQSIGGAIGTTIYGPGATTRVTASSNGAVSVSSDITIGDGASLNLSGQISSNGPLLGIGFTFSS
ncbi:hypothetical protein NEIRO03_0832 [Nematocida sp. AWRm78]|nr:hypothetical protein NEIRO02_0754 [Nematocida sp. AWRm79]KAI5183214.1 hypothetical protein NEIRO03_0832 [Nematocida sp. AWRm78]